MRLTEIAAAIAQLDEPETDQVLDLAAALEDVAAVEAVDGDALRNLMVKLARQLAPRCPADLNAARSVLRLADIGLRAERAQGVRDDAFGELRTAIRESVALGVTQVDAATLGRVNRMTVRSAIDG